MERREVIRVCTTELIFLCNKGTSVSVLLLTIKPPINEDSNTKIVHISFIYSYA